MKPINRKDQKIGSPPFALGSKPSLIFCLLSLLFSAPTMAAIPLEFRSQLFVDLSEFETVNDIVTSSSDAYVLTSRKVLVVDLRRLPDLRLVPVENTWGGRSLCLRDKRLVVATGGPYLTDLSLDFSGMPAYSGQWSVESAADLIHISRLGRYGFVVGSAAKVRVIDLASSQRTFLWEPNYTGDGYAGAPSDGVFFLTTGNSNPGMRVMPVASNMKPGSAKTVRTPGIATDVVAADGLAYVACTSAGLTVVDGRTPSSPSIKSTTVLGGDVWKVELLGNRLYAGLVRTLPTRPFTRRAALQVVSLPTVGNPVAEGLLETTGNLDSESPAGIAVIDHRVLFASTLEIGGIRRARILMASTVPAPKITAQPKDQILWLGQALALTVATESSTPVLYQWYRGSSGDISRPVEGANSATFSTSTETGSVSYWVRASSFGESTDSSAARVLVAEKPIMQAIRQPNRSLVLRFIGEPGTSWRLIHSNDLVEWSPASDWFTLTSAFHAISSAHIDAELEYYMCEQDQ